MQILSNFQIWRMKTKLLSFVKILKDGFKNFEIMECWKNGMLEICIFPSFHLSIIPLFHYSSYNSRQFIEFLLKNSQPNASKFQQL